MPSHTLRAVPVPKTASPEVSQSFRLLSQNTNQQNQELTQVLGDSGADTATLAPTSIPHDTTATLIVNEDSSMDVVLTWQYAQGMLPAENFVLFWNEGAAPLPAVTVDSNAVMVGADARAFRFEGLNPKNNYRFGIAAGRRPTATSGMVVGAIVAPSVGPGNWADLTFGNPNYVGTVWGMEQHDFVVDAAGTSATNQTVRIQKDTVVLWNPGIAAHSYNVLVYDLATKLVVSQTTYDVQGNPGAATTLANDLNALTGGKLIIVVTAGNPAVNRLGFGLPLALAAIGGSRTLFSSDSFQTGAAYILVGKPLLGEGNGLEQYAGKTANAADAHVTLTFQTQDDQLVALSGTGWQQAHTPGVPSTDPTGLALTNTTVDTGNRLHKLTWAYTQPSLSGDNKLADGFILYYASGNPATIPAINEQQVKLDPAVRAHTLEWSLAPGALVSYAIAPYRKTASGVEVRAAVSTGTWRGVAADRVVTNQGIGPGEVQGSGGGGVNNVGGGTLDTPDLTGDGVTTDKRQAVSTQSTSTGVVPPNNSTTSPTLFTNNAVLFSVSLSKVPTVIARSNVTLWPCNVATEGPTAISVNSTNLSIVSGSATIAVDYW
jgi:hypothetical protein